MSGTAAPQGAPPVQHNERIYRKFIDLTSEGYWMMNAERVIVEVNDALCRMLGFAREEMIGRRPFDFAEGENLEIFKVQSAQISQTLHRIYNITLKAKDGRDVHTRFSATTVRDEEGKPLYSFAFITDVTELRLAEGTLRESEERFRRFAEATFEGIIIVENGIIVDANQRLAEMGGFELADLIGRSVLDFIAPESRELVTSNIRSQHRGRYEARALKQDGTAFPVEICGRTLIYRGHEVRVTAVLDLTERKKMEDRLRQSLSEREIILENVGLGIALAGRRKFLWVNPQFEELFGFAKGEMAGQSICLVHPSCKTFLEFARAARAAMSQGRPFQTQCLMKRKDGSLFWCRIVGKAIDPADLPNGTLWIVEDISERIKAESKLRLAATVFDSSVEGILITDAATRIVTVNQAFTAITGYRLGEVAGKTPALLSSGRHGEEFYQHMWASLNLAGQWQGEIWNRRKNGDVYPEWLTISAVRNEHQELTNYVAVFSDITSRKLAEERLNYLANHDALTGLPNRTLFMERLSQALAHAHRNGRRVAIMFFDLDRFKIINDTLGHAVGDLLLQAVAKRVSGCLREDDTVARLGGDEFTVILEGVTQEQDVAGVAQKIIATLAEPFQVEGHEIFISASIGISLYPNDGEDAATLLKHADSAMYQAKDMGKDTYQFFKADMNVRAFERLSLENSLRRALEREEFQLYFQPQVEMASGCVVGAEALIRWRHPDMGMIAPDRFIPIAEETGLILPIGEWVIHTACAQNRTWQEAGMPRLRIGVNLSARQFKQKELIRVIERALSLTGLDPASLDLEITESVIMEHAAGTIAMLRDMKAMGIHLSIDDFGTGYSSLSYLKRFPIDALKIDRSFVRDITTDQDDAAITAAVIALAHSLKLKVIAEGVETREQLVFLREHRCDEMQGFYLSQPIPAEAFAGRLKDGWRPV